MIIHYLIYYMILHLYDIILFGIINNISIYLGNKEVRQYDFNGLIKLYEKSIIKMNKFLKEKSKDLGPIDLEKYDHLTDEELHEVLETKRLKEEQDDEDSDEPTNILQFPKIFH